MKDWHITSELCKHSAGKADIPQKCSDDCKNSGNYECRWRRFGGGQVCKWFYDDGLQNYGVPYDWEPEIHHRPSNLEQLMAEENKELNKACQVKANSEFQSFVSEFNQLQQNCGKTISNDQCIDRSADLKRKIENSLTDVRHRH